MSFPAFFDQVPSLILCDPLANVLGATSDGVIEYHYTDAVKLAGHSCPTVAGAWLMGSRALAELYPDTLPERGNLRVELRAPQNAGTSGVVGAVLGLITGAAGEGGFKGLGGRHVRCNLLEFGADIDADARITRLDNNTAVWVDLHPEAVPPAAEMPPLMARVVSGAANEQERAQFALLWQDRVRRMLLQHATDSALIGVRRVSG
jgi:hypothetical protein